MILKGNILKKQDKIDEAKKWFYKAYKTLPTNSFIVSEIASFFSELNDHKSTLFFQKHLTNQDDKKSDYWGNIGNTFLSLGLNDHAMVAYEKGNELTEGKERWLIANIGNLYNNVGLYSKAIEFLQRATEISPSDQYSHNRLASALSNKKDEESKVSKILAEVKTTIANADEG